MGSYGSIILIVVMIIAFYFLIMRPQRKRQQQQVDMVKQLEPGTRIVTTTGIYATVVAVGDRQIVLETAPGTRVTMLKQAVGRVVGQNEEDAELSSYRGTGALSGAGTAGEPTGGFGEPAPGTGTEQEYGSASGLAGGAPIQEYSPGSGPEFTPAGDTTEAHQTSPWPAPGSSQPGTAEPSIGDGDVTGGSRNPADDPDHPYGDRPYGEHPYGDRPSER